MTKDNSNITYEVSALKARFHEIEIEKQSDNSWQYTRDPFHRIGVGTKVGAFYEKFIKKVRVGKAKHELNATDTILCNSAYAADLWVNKIITDAMINSIEVGVIGAGRGMTPLIIIPKQKVLLEGEPVTLKIIIVDSFSHSNFEFIDKDNKILQW